MTELIKTLTAVAESEKLPTNSEKTKLEQKYARALKESITQKLVSIFSAVATDEVKVVRTADGVVLAIDTEAGFVSVVLDASIKNLDYDPFQEADDYEQDILAKKAKAEADAKAKEAKKAKDAEARKAKAEAKKLARAAKATASN